MNLDMVSIDRLALCAVEVFMLYFFFKAMFKLRKYHSGIYVLFFVIEAGFILFINAYSNTWLNLIVIPILYLLFALLMFKLSFVSGLTYTLIYYAIFSGGREAAYEMFYRLVSISFQFHIPDWFTPAGYYYLLPENALGFLFLIIIARSLKKLDIGEQQGFSWYLLIMPVLSLIILSSFLYMDFTDSVLIQGLVCVGAFFLYFSNAAIFLLLEKYKGIMNLAKCEEISHFKQALEDDKFQNIARLNKHYRDYMHEIHLHLTQIRALASKEQHEKIIEIVNGLEGGIQMEESNIVYNSNEILNTILAERIIKAPNKGIELSVFIEPYLNVDFISGIDMISMFGNLLDNALEAAAQCESGNRNVDAKMFMGNRYMLVLYIKNSFTVPAKRKDKRYLTTKKEKELHGLGLGIVNRLAEKYGGNLLLEDNGKYFITTLSISTVIDK